MARTLAVGVSQLLPLGQGPNKPCERKLRAAREGMEPRLRGCSQDASSQAVGGEPSQPPRKLEVPGGRLMFSQEKAAQPEQLRVPSPERQRRGGGVCTLYLKI